jgi:hypothetical protein
MNKQNLITLNELANSLNEKGFYKEANIIHEQFIKLSISPDEILMPGEYKPTIESDDSNVEIKLNDILEKLNEIKDNINSLPEYTSSEAQYDSDTRAFPMHKGWALDYIKDTIQEIINLKEVI